MKAKNLKFGPKGHPLQRVKQGAESGQTRHKSPRYERSGKIVEAPRSRKTPCRVGA